MVAPSFQCVRGLFQVRSAAGYQRQHQSLRDFGVVREAKNSLHVLTSVTVALKFAAWEYSSEELNVVAKFIEGFTQAVPCLGSKLAFVVRALFRLCCHAIEKRRR